MNFNKILLIIIVLLIIFGAWANWPKDKANVEATPAEVFVQPVREGNCWRQFIGVGTKDNVLVCG